jgi:hypothetical protein
MRRPFRKTVIEAARIKEPRLGLSCSRGSLLSDPGKGMVTIVNERLMGAIAESW